MATEEELQEAEASLSSLEYERDCLQQDLSDVQHDLMQWQDRAYEAEGRVDDIEAELSEAQESYHDLEVEHDRRAYERDCYKSVLEGMEFIELDSYPEKGPEFCKRLGIEAKDTIETVINQAMEKK